MIIINISYTSYKTHGPRSDSEFFFSSFFEQGSHTFKLFHKMFYHDLQGRRYSIGGKTHNNYTPKQVLYMHKQCINSLGENPVCSGREWLLVSSGLNWYLMVSTGFNRTSLSDRLSKTRLQLASMWISSDQDIIISLQLDQLFDRYCAVIAWQGSHGKL